MNERRWYGEMMDSDGGGLGDLGDLHRGYSTSVAAGGIYAGFAQSHG